MTVLTERQHKGEYIVSEGNGSISREVGTLTSGEVVVDGQVLAMVANKLVAAEGTYNSDTGESDEDIVGIAFGDYDATDGDLEGVVYTARLAEVQEENLTLYVETSSDSESDVGALSEAAVVAALAEKFIILR